MATKAERTLSSMIKYLCFLFMISTSLTLNCIGQEKDPWQPWSWLVGDWIGEGSGQPGQGIGRDSFSLELERNILVRKSHSEYPATDRKPAITHDDMMIVYADTAGLPSRAIYFDNESHVLHYSATYADRSIILTSDKMLSMPVFRLTYTWIDSSTMNTRFEMSRDGVHFMTYVEGKSRKTH